MIYNMSSNRMFDCNGQNNSLIFNVRTQLSSIGQSIAEEFNFGMRNIDNSDKWGFLFSVRGDNSYVINVLTDNLKSLIPQASWNINQTIQSPRDTPLNIYMDFNNEYIIFGEIYDGRKNPKHIHYIETIIGSKYWHMSKLPILIETRTSDDHTSFSSYIFNVRLIQEYKILDSESTKTPFSYLLSSFQDSSFNCDRNFTTSTDFSYSTIASNCYVSRLIWYFQNNATFDIDDLGSVSVSNGIKIFYTQNGGPKIYWNAQKPIMSNADWATICFDMRNDSSEYLGENNMTCRLSFFKSGGYINLPSINDTFGVELEDDYAIITTMTFNIQGYYQS